MTLPHIEKAALALFVLHGWTEELARAEIASGSLCGKDRLAEATIVWNLAMKEAAKAMRDEIEDQGFSAGELWIADRIEKRLRALSVEG